MYNSTLGIQLASNLKRTRLKSLVARRNYKDGNLGGAV
jgi:hypothetical protein